MDVFRAGVGGFHSYRIPALLTTANGSLLAFAEARRDDRGDPGNGDIDLVLSRSSDQGRTWSVPQLVDDPGEEWSASNPIPLLDRSNGRIWIFVNRWQPGFGTDKAQPGTAHTQMWARMSDLTRDSREYRRQLHRNPWPDAGLRHLQ